ncbi:HlyD family type I secretion periplasmic adaptor subunit [Stappia sp. F7233]|uniref:Membrane fusion protein (MFP) family protein n=1 Tax=Stappia albiluteola TaxID=2758565 RepID=A0A839A9E2_9HYPH|nr:HlyD family type I secretion periplasmic adaptor subunit [Stappia albiluteola]MBA5775981.1 HlyD family type I secretion periplasmic adaptor subunit [Stappia albiluteola]
MSYLAVNDSFDQQIHRATRKATMAGYGLLAGCVLVFAFWANAAPISGAVISSGVFVATGENKIVQHFEGGVIKEIKVREGDLVEPGESLVVLDDTTPRAELRRLELRLARLMAMQSRFEAEMNWDTEISFPAVMTMQEEADPDIAAIIDAQKLTFTARRNTLESEIATLADGINALQQRIGGSNTQLEAVRSQLALIEEELQGKTSLLKSGLIRKPEILALQRAQANLQGEIGRLTGEIGDARERIARIKEQIQVARNTTIKTVVEQLHDVNAEMDDVKERIRSARAILDRINITAPVEGVVVKLRYHTPGGVIEAGKNVLEIVPVQEELIIEVPVRPQDIDNVREGQAAVIRLTALNKRITPMIDGKVIYISADALPNDKRSQLTPTTSSGPDVYVARVALDPSWVQKVPEFKPTPGMPAEVYIKTHERTFFEYLMRPIRDSMQRAFRES